MVTFTPQLTVQSRFGQQPIMPTLPASPQTIPFSGYDQASFSSSANQPSQVQFGAIPRRMVAGSALALILALTGCAGAARHASSDEADKSATPSASAPKTPGPSSTGGTTAGAESVKLLNNYKASYRFPENPDGQSVTDIVKDIEPFLDWAQRQKGVNQDALQKAQSQLAIGPALMIENTYLGLDDKFLTLGSESQDKQARYALFMLKIMLSDKDYSDLISNQALIKGSPFIQIGSFSTNRGTNSLESKVPQGVVNTFRDSKRKFLVANPASKLEAGVLKKNGIEGRDGLVAYVNALRIGEAAVATYDALCLAKQSA